MLTLADLQLTRDIETELQRAYKINDAWLSDLALIAAAIDTNQPPARIPDTTPWGLVAEQLMTGRTYGEGITPAALRNAVVMVIGKAIAWRREGDKRQKMSSKLTAMKAARVIAPYLESPDEDLKARISFALTEKERTAHERKQIAEAYLTDWLGGRGRFIRTPEGFLYYLYENNHRLFDMNSTAFESWLHVLTGVNPATLDFKVLLNAAKSAALNLSETHQVVKLAHWDGETLRISRFDGVVYRLDGETIQQEANGEGPVLFLDAPTWKPYAPDYVMDDDFLVPFTRPTWSVKSGWAAAVWVMSLMFTELCPTRPIAVFLGEKGSGKSMALRMILKLLFGELAELGSTPDKPDDFLVSAYHNHILALDNFDGFQEWMRDKLASLATGVEMQFRTLYTNKEVTLMRFRSWIAVTARQPDTLKRDDLADRLLILKLERVGDEKREREGKILSQLLSDRNRWWGAFLQHLNLVVATLKEGDLPAQSSLRMADWEVFGRMVSQTFNKLDQWDEIVRDLKKEQGKFVAEDIVVEAIEKWLAKSYENVGREVLARTLYAECEETLFGGGKPDSDWPRSVISFGKRIENISEYLKQQFGLEIFKNPSGNRYKFKGLRG